MYYYVQLVVLASVVMEPLFSSLVLVDMVLKVSVGETWMRWLWGPPPSGASGDLPLEGAPFDQDTDDADSEVPGTGVDRCPRQGPYAAMSTAGRYWGIARGGAACGRAVLTPSAGRIRSTFDFTRSLFRHRTPLAR